MSFCGLVAYVLLRNSEQLSWQTESRRKIELTQVLSKVTIFMVIIFLIYNNSLLLLSKPTTKTCLQLISFILVIQPLRLLPLLH